MDNTASSENRLQSQNFSTVDNYTTQGIIVQNNHLVRSERGSYKEINNLGISPEDIDDALNRRNSWWRMPVKFHGKWTCFKKILDSFMEPGKKEANTYYYYLDEIGKIIKNLQETGYLIPVAFDAMNKTICNCAVTYLKYWDKVFKNRMPSDDSPSEKRMWIELGNPIPKNSLQAQEKDGVDSCTTDTENVQN